MGFDQTLRNGAGELLSQKTFCVRNTSLISRIYVEITVGMSATGEDSDADLLVCGRVELSEGLNPSDRRRVGGKANRGISCSITPR